MNENCKRRRHRLTLTIHSSRKNITLSFFWQKKKTNSTNKEINGFISIAHVLFKSDNEEEFGIFHFLEHASIVTERS